MLIYDSAPVTAVDDRCPHAVSFWVTHSFIDLQSTLVSLSVTLLFIFVTFMSFHYSETTFSLIKYANYDIFQMSQAYNA